MNWKTILDKEYRAMPDSFVNQLSCHASWNQNAYELLFVAMKECCREYEGHEKIPRWISELFWRLDWWVEEQVERLFTGTPEYNFYMNNAVVNFNHLACNLFMNEKRDDDGYEPYCW